MSQTVVTPMFFGESSGQPGSIEQAVGASAIHGQLFSADSETVATRSFLRSFRRGMKKTKRGVPGRVFIVVSLVIVALGIAGSFSALSIVSAEESHSVQLAAAKDTRPATASSLVMTLPRSAVPGTLQTIENQPVTLTVGTQSVTVPASTISGWIKVSVDSANPNDENLFVQTSTMTSSLNTLANSYLVTPVDQVAVVHTDGVTPSGIILAGQNGTKLTSATELNSQVQQLAPSLFSSKGMSFNAPVVTAAYQDLTPSDFSKLIEVDVTTKRMYVYASGQLVNSFLVSAGKPSTPTPIGEFHIWAKLTSQTMTGPGYVQPNVPWINYFDHSGDAIHGNYWRPASVFGSVNTSHGCVGLPVDEAEWVYNWAPIGTTVITYSQVTPLT